MCKDDACTVQPADSRGKRDWVASWFGTYKFQERELSQNEHLVMTSGGKCVFICDFANQDWLI